MKQKMGINAQGRTIGQIEDVHILREPESAYSVHLGGEKVNLSHKNTGCFDESTG